MSAIFGVCPSFDSPVAPSCLAGPDSDCGAAYLLSTAAEGGQMKRDMAGLFCGYSGVYSRALLENGV